jgi:hypothetical protein
MKKTQKHTEETLISKAWLVGAMATALEHAKILREKSEAEHPLLFGHTEPEVIESHRKVVVGIWDEIFSALNCLHEEFKEGPNA